MPWQRCGTISSATTPCCGGCGPVPRETLARLSLAMSDKAGETAADRGPNGPANRGSSLSPTDEGRRAAPPSDRLACLLADHDDREGARYRAGAAPARTARWRRWWWWWCRLRCHHEHMARLAVEADGARAVIGPGLQVLLDLEARRTLLLDDGHRAVALRTERFHRRRIELRTVGTARERQP